MSWRIKTEHRSAYTYAEPVNTSFNEARITPAAARGQSVIESSVTIEPQATQLTYVDYWSSLVVAFDITEPHSQLTVTGRSIVETPSEQPQSVALGWDELSSEPVVDRFIEYLLPTPYTDGDHALIEIADRLVKGATPAETLAAAGDWTRANLEYVPGATRASTSALDAWRQGAGVCQDFAHLTLALLRIAGVPARYVSGYLHPHAEAEVGDTTTGQSHAWIEAWLGSWVAMDPTNGAAVAERHVTVARGRDYADVAPFRGIYHGGALDSLDVSVTLTRLA